MNRLAAGIAPISLAELVDRAELMTRVDRKYLVPAAAAHAVLDRWRDSARVLTIRGETGFRYDSVYFDTACDEAYRRTAQRRRHRFKLRTRSYLDTGGTFLELKTKNGRGRTVKVRRPHPIGERAELSAGSRDFVRRLLPQYRLAPELADRVEPSLVSRYSRTTLLLPDGSRVTVDADLAWHLPDGGAAGARGCRPGCRVPGAVILETKSAGTAGALDRALWRSGYRPTGISKFGVGTALLRPELSANKWARTLRTLRAAAVAERAPRAPSVADPPPPDAPPHDAPAAGPAAAEPPAPRLPATDPPAPHTRHSHTEDTP